MNTPVAETGRDTSRAVARGIGIGIAAVAVVVGGWFGFSAWRDSRNSETAQISEQAPVATEQSTSTEDPHDRARAQIAADRIAQPVGDNAAETYLAILAADPKDSSARQALTELLPLINDVASASADAGDSVELERLIGVIAQVDERFAQLPRLRARVVEINRALEVAKLAAEREAAALLARQQQAAAPRAPAPVPTSVPVTPSTTQSPPPAAVSTSAASRAPAPSTPLASLPDTTRPPAATTASIAPPPSVRVQVVEPVLINKVDPRYPQQALARRLEGWVEVEFTIGTDGSTTGATVVAAQPVNPHFAREALRAAERWRFQPKTVDGVPTQAKLRRRLNFRMPS